MQLYANERLLNPYRLLTRPLHSTNNTHYLPSSFMLNMLHAIYASDYYCIIRRIAIMRVCASLYILKSYHAFYYFNTAFAYICFFLSLSLFHTTHFSSVLLRSCSCIFVSFCRVRVCAVVVTYKRNPSAGASVRPAVVVAAGGASVEAAAVVDAADAASTTSTAAAATSTIGTRPNVTGATVEQRSDHIATAPPTTNVAPPTPPTAPAAGSSGQLASNGTVDFSASSCK